MFSQTYYVLRSRLDGQYLVARAPQQPADRTNQSSDQFANQPADPSTNQSASEPSSSRFLILFKADYDALSYINTHAPEVAPQFQVESLAGTQLKALINRWGFSGIGLVKDPLVPQVEFLTV
ncbi:MAG: hypothetical protein AAGF66_08145 [Cyanobacteria bacterium P01_H01_bin.119]